MSEAHVAKFAEIAAKDPALLARLGLEQVSDEASARSCVAKAVKEAKAVGLEFTETEGYDWMQSQMTSSDELSDTQLEAVAGGKGPDRGSMAGKLDLGRGDKTDKAIRIGIAVGTLGITELPIFRGW